MLNKLGLWEIQIKPQYDQQLFMAKTKISNKAKDADQLEIS